MVQQSFRKLFRIAIHTDLTAKYSEGLQGCFAGLHDNFNNKIQPVALQQLQVWSGAPRDIIFSFSSLDFLILDVTLNIRLIDCSFRLIYDQH